ncbi:hypothetical protein EE612_005549, partial [Oryza sativa]
MKRRPRSALWAPERVRSSCARCRRAARAASADSRPDGACASLRLWLRPNRLVRSCENCRARAMASALSSCENCSSRCDELLRIDGDLDRDDDDDGPPVSSPRADAAPAPAPTRRRRRGLDAPKHNGVVVLQVERDLDQLLPVVGAPVVGPARRRARAQRPRCRPRRAPSLGSRGGAAPHHRRRRRANLSSSRDGPNARRPRAGWMWNLWEKAPSRRVGAGEETSRAEERGRAAGEQYMGDRQV